jgi:ABC-2 type transport system ATP-binding protein
MDEAEYCGRVGIMRDGKLLAMDAPSSLKATALPGKAWDVFVDGGSSAPLLAALNALQDCPCVLRVGLTGDHLRAITPGDVDANALLERLADAAIEGRRVEQVEPTLEDVFLALAVK